MVPLGSSRRTRTLRTALAAALVVSVGACSSARHGTHLSAPRTVAPTVPSTAPARPPPSTNTVPVLRPTGRAPRVELFGDSLGLEAAGFFTEQLTLAGAQVRTRTLGGTAICDFLPGIASEEASWHPDVAVIQFSGNSLTPCMTDPTTAKPYTGAALVAEYRVSAATAIGILTTGGTRVVLAASPTGRRDTPGAHPLTDMYRDLAASRPGVTFVDAGAAVTANGGYTDRLPCLPGEPCSGTGAETGTNPVRAPDGAHFCPSAPPTVRDGVAACATWSSGAWRFAVALAGAAAPLVGLTVPPTALADAVWIWAHSGGG